MASLPEHQLLPPPPPMHPVDTWPTMGGGRRDEGEFWKPEMSGGTGSAPSFSTQQHLHPSTPDGYACSPDRFACSDASVGHYKPLASLGTLIKCV